jgi:hypothetical protein
MKFVTVLLGDLLKRPFSCRDLASEKKITEIGRPTAFLTKMVKVKEQVMLFFLFLV